MAFVYSKIFFEVSRQINNIRKESYPGWQKVEEMKNAERKVISIFAVMLMVYTVCWLPYFILRFIFNDGDLHPLVAHISTWLRFLTSFLNPCLYILGKKDFRKALSRRRSRDKRCQIFLADPLERSGWSLCHKTKTTSEFLVLLVNTYTLSQGRRKGMDVIPSGSFSPFFLFFLLGFERVIWISRRLRRINCWSGYSAIFKLSLYFCRKHILVCWACYS